MWHLRELPVHGGAGKRLAHCSAIGWGAPRPTFSDGRNGWPWATIGHGERPPPRPPPLHPSLHTSLIPVLSRCQSARWVRYPILLPLYRSVCSSWYITQMEFLVVSTSGQIAFVDPADHRCNSRLCGTPRPSPTPPMMSLISALSLLCKVDLRRWILKMF